MSKPELCVGVCGAGGWFVQRAHLPGWQRIEKRRDLEFTVRVVAVFSRAGASGERARKRLGAWGAQLRWYDDFEALLADAEVDVLDIALPIPSQLAFVERALAAGKSVVSEKPICAAAENALHAFRLAALAQPPRAWSVLENWACKPSVLAVRHLLEAGAIGNPEAYTARLVRAVGPADTLGWRTPGSYKGCFLLDVGVHLLRATRVWFGEVEEVCDVQLADGGVSGRASLTHRRDARVVCGTLEWQFIVGAASAPDTLQPLASFVVRGSAGSLEWDADEGSVRVQRAPLQEQAPAADSVALEQPAEAQASIERRVEGDRWVAGGVREALVDALVHTAHVHGLVARTPSGPHRTSPVEAARDALCVRAICESAHCAGGRVRPAELGGILSRGVPLADAMGTWRELPEWRCECACELDVLLALCALVQLQAERGVRVHVAAVGAGHSWAVRAAPPLVTGAAAPAAEQLAASAPVPAPATWLRARLHVRALEWVHVRPPSPSGEGHRVRVGAGTTLRALVACLRAHGLCLPSLPMHLDATVGGAVCAGSHGSSLHHGTLSDSVTDVRLATADGRARWLLAEGGGGGGGEGAVASDLLAAVRVSLGALGVVTAVELALSPLCAVRRASERLPFRTADDVSVLVARARASEHAWVHWRLGEGEAQLTVLERAAKPQQLAGLQLAESLPSASLPAQSRPSGSQHLAGSRHAGSQCAAYDGLNWFATPAVLPDDGVGADEAPTSAQPAAAPAAGSTEPLGGTAEVPAPSMEPAAAVWVSSEYALPLHSMADAVDALAAALGESHRGRLVECKFAGKPASASLLGCNGGGEVCCFNVWWRATWTSVDERAGATLRPFEEVMQRLGATPHWGKHHALPARYVERVFGGRAERFQAVARQLDPGGMFAPDWSHDVNIVNN